MDRKEDWSKEVFAYMRMIIIVVMVSLGINNYVIINADVISGSMEGTIMTDDRILGNRLAYTFEDPKRFDIVIFKFPDDETQRYVKRIIGLPGDIVEIMEGKVYINGSMTSLEDSFIQEPWVVDNGPYGPYKVPEGHYFMLGDNRNYSWDSPDWNNTFVSKDSILGKAGICYYPFSSFGFVE